MQKKAGPFLTLPVIKEKLIEKGYRACGDQNGLVFPISARAAMKLRRYS